MKNLLLSLIAVFILFGCGKPIPSFKNSTGVKYSLYPESKNNYRIQYPSMKEYSQALKRNNRNIVQAKTDLYKGLFNIAALETRKKGFNYFVLTNSNFSNLNGFPISDFKTFMKYITLKFRKDNFSTSEVGHDGDSLMLNGVISMKFMPVSNKIANSGLVSVWKVSDFIK